MVGASVHTIGAVRRRPSASPSAAPANSSSAGEGSLWPLYRGTRAVTSTGAGSPGGWPRELADMMR
eukprot:1651361-Prymnesium_polylepis.1